MSSASRNSLFAHRWAGFVSAILLMQFSGSYCFSIYSTALKQVLHINQVQLNNLSVAKDLGDAMGVVAGVMSNHISAWALLTIGGVVSLVGYGTQWLVVSTTISPLGYWVMFLAALLAGNSVSWMNTAIFMMSVRNFPGNRGPVVGLYKAYMGLTAAVFSELSAVLFSNSPSKLLLLLTVLPSGTCILSALCLRPLPPAETAEEHKEETSSLFLFNLVAVFLAVYLLAIDLYLPNIGAVRRVGVGVFLLILAAPILVPFYVFYRIKSDFTSSRLGDEEVRDGDKEIYEFDQGVLTEPLLKENSNESPKISKGCRGSWFKQLPEMGADRDILELLRSWDFLVLYISCFCSIGAGVTFSNNLGQIGQAMGIKSVTLITSFFSLGNFFGRICSGNASEYFLRTAALPRSVWMGVAKLPMIAMCLWLATGSQASVYGGSIILGVCHGLHITIMIPIVSEFYGLKHFGINYTVSTTSLLCGSLAFSGLMAGKLYDMEAWRQEQPTIGTLTCSGPTCYRLTFIILAVGLMVGAGGDAVLSYVSRGLYRELQKANTFSAAAAGGMSEEKEEGGAL